MDENKTLLTTIYIFL